MFCKHCGYEINEDAAFCKKCGAKLADQLEQKPVEEEAVTQEPVEMEAAKQEAVEEAVKQETVEEVAEKPEAESEFATLDTPVEKPKKSKKRGWLVAAIVTGSLAVLVALTIFLGPKLFPNAYRLVEGWAIKTFSTPDNYLQFVEENATTKTVDGVVSAYSKYLDRLGNNKLTTGAAQATVQVRVGDKLKDSFGMAGASAEVDWLKSASLAIDANMKDSAGQMLMALSLNDKQIANAELIMDMDQGAVYLALRPLSDKYLKIDLEMDEEFSEIFAAMSSSEMKEVLPAPETVGVLVERYSKLFYESLKDAEKTTETIEIEGVEQKVTVLTVELDSDAVKQMAKTMLETIVEDEEVRQIMENIAGYMQEKGMISDADMACESFVEAIEEGLAEFDDVEFDGYDNIGINFYVNNSHEIVGMQYEIDSEAVRYITVRDGEKFAFELDADVLKINGSGTEKDGVVNGEYTFKVEGEKVFTVAVENFSQKDGLVKGKLVLTPSKNLMEEMGLGSAAGAMVAMVDPALELVFANETNSASLEINLLSGKDLLVGITVSAQEKTAGDITMPDPNKVVSEGNAEQWAESFDLEGLRKQLIDAGVPQSLLEFLPY